MRSEYEAQEQMINATLAARAKRDLIRKRSTQAVILKKPRMAGYLIIAVVCVAAVCGMMIIARM